MSPPQTYKPLPSMRRHGSSTEASDRPSDRRARTSTPDSGIGAPSPQHRPRSQAVTPDTTALAVQQTGEQFWLRGAGGRAQAAARSVQQQPVRQHGYRDQQQQRSGALDQLPECQKETQRVSQIMTNSRPQLRQLPQYHQQGHHGQHGHHGQASDRRQLSNQDHHMADLADHSLPLTYTGTSPPRREKKTKALVESWANKWDRLGDDTGRG